MSWHLQRVWLAGFGCCGMSMRWRYVEVVEIDDQGIHAIIGPLNLDRWLLSGIYAQPRKPNKIRLFNKLRSVSASMELPWLVTGDFNEIGFAHEKQGGRVASVSRLLFFQQCMDAFGLQDLGFQGPNFTWTNEGEWENYSRTYRSSVGK